MTTGRPRDGEPIAVSGFPLNKPVLISTVGHLASSWPIEIDATNVGFTPGVPRVERETYLADVTANAGNSGGPVYRLSDSAVIGVLVAGEGAQAWVAGSEPALKANGDQIFFAAGSTSLAPFPKGYWSVSVWRWRVSAWLQALPAPYTFCDSRCPV